MSKNPAWNAYNESVRAINDEYEATVKPLRAKLSEEVMATEKRFDAQIDPLVREKKAIVEKLREDYADEVKATETKRRKAVNVAHGVLQAELSAAKMKTAEEAVGA